MDNNPLRFPTGSRWVFLGPFCSATKPLPWPLHRAAIGPIAPTTAIAGSNLNLIAVDPSCTQDGSCDYLSSFHSWQNTSSTTEAKARLATSPCAQLGSRAWASVTARIAGAGRTHREHLPVLAGGLSVLFEAYQFMQKGVAMAGLMYCDGNWSSTSRWFSSQKLDSGLWRRLWRIAPTAVQKGMRCM